MNAAIPFTKPDSLRWAFELQREAFAEDMWPSRKERQDRLDRLLALTERCSEAIVRAAAADFGHRSPHVTRLADVMMVQATIRHTRRRLGRWMQTRRVPTSLPFLPGKSRLMPQPLGVVGVMAPWNYPFQLALGPAAAALAAGNRVMIKPSELAPRCAEVLREGVQSLFTPAELIVCPGDAEVGRAFAQLPFDHLLFTGSTAVGREVALAAARNLTPVTLELGGKSPAILAPDCDLARAARSLVLGKMFNAGQTCIAPDYVLVPRALVDAFVVEMGRAVQQLYPDLSRNPDCTSIVNDRHHKRLAALLDDAHSRGAMPVPARARRTGGDAAAGEAHAGARLHRGHGDHARGNLRAAAAGGGV
jgi:coniferyl-aldehyde dehydrogenase